MRRTSSASAIDTPPGTRLWHEHRLGPATDGCRLGDIRAVVRQDGPMHTSDGQAVRPRTLLLTALAALLLAAAITAVIPRLVQFCAASAVQTTASWSTAVLLLLAVVTGTASIVVKLTE